MIDKGTEYLANFNSKTRQNPVDLLRAYITTTGKAPRYLRVDGAKEFVSDEMVAFCTAEKIVLQVVVAYNHTMQARVEGAIDYVKQHSRVSMLAANAVRGPISHIFTSTYENFLQTAGLQDGASHCAKILSSMPSFKILASLNTAQFFCIVLCILSLSTEVGVPPFEFLNLSNLEVVFLTPLATARTRPLFLVRTVTMRSASPSL